MPATGTTFNPRTEWHAAIVAALAEGGHRSAGQLAECLGMPYSTVTVRLRQLEADGFTERRNSPASRQTIWQATRKALRSARISAGTPKPDMATVGDDDRDTAYARDVHTRAGSDDGSGALSVGDSDQSGLTVAGTEGRDATPDSGQAGEESTSRTEPTGCATVARGRPSPEAADAGADIPTSKRRPKGAIAAAILAVTRDHPDTSFKVSELRKALDGVSAGAIANAATKLVVTGELLCVRESPATYQAA
jgi:DNA-binding transcriptional ArsR family regulator